MSAFGLGSIRGFLGLDASDYTKGILDAQVANEVFGHSVTNFVNNPLLGSIQILKGLAVGTAQAVRETAFLNQEYLRTSERIGISTRTISGLQMAYRDMGLQAQEFEKQLTKLSIKVDEASQGNETSARLFQRLGVAVTDAAGQMRSLDDIFRDVSDGLAGLGSQQEKVAIGNLLFGESFVRVLQIIGDGGRVIEDFIEKASRYGQVVEDDAARASNELASALGDLGFAADGARKRLSTRFITAFIDEFAGGPAAVDQLATSIGKLEPAATAAGTAVGTWVREMIEGLGIVLERFEKTNEQVAALQRKFNEMSADEKIDDLLVGKFPGTNFVGLDVRPHLERYGVTEADVRRAGRAHDADYLAAELDALHARQADMRRRRASQ